MTWLVLDTRTDTVVGTFGTEDEAWEYVVRPCVTSGRDTDTWDVRYYEAGDDG